MNYKDIIMQMVGRIEDETLLQRIFKFISRLLTHLP